MNILLFLWHYHRNKNSLKTVTNNFSIKVKKCIYCNLAGAQKKGVAGFFKGVGKGLVGAVARPTGGIIDMASSTFQGIKR